LVLLGSVLADLVASTWQVTLAVLRPTPDRVHAEVIPVELDSTSPLVCTIVANAITLTPGTMTVDFDPDVSELRVHVLGRVDHDEFRASVRTLEQRVVAAVGTGVER
jgi:multicomponent Na+:H+ antiporter subunit E